MLTKCYKSILFFFFFLITTGVVAESSCKILFSKFAQIYSFKNLWKAFSKKEEHTFLQTLRRLLIFPIDSTISYSTMAWKTAKNGESFLELPYKIIERDGKLISGTLIIYAIGYRLFMFNDPSLEYEKENEATALACKKIVIFSSYSENSVGDRLKKPGKVAREKAEQLDDLCPKLKNVFYVDLEAPEAKEQFLNAFHDEKKAQTYYFTSHGNSGYSVAYEAAVDKIGVDMLRNYINRDAHVQIFGCRVARGDSGKEYIRSVYDQMFGGQGGRVSAARKSLLDGTRLETKVSGVVLPPATVFHSAIDIYFDISSNESSEGVKESFKNLVDSMINGGTYTYSKEP